MHMSFKGPGSSLNNSKSDVFTWNNFKLQVLLGNQKEAIETMRKFKFSDILFFRVVPESSDLKFAGNVNGQHLNILQFAVA